MILCLLWKFRAASSATAQIDIVTNLDKFSHVYQQSNLLQDLTAWSHSTNMQLQLDKT